MQKTNTQKNIVKMCMSTQADKCHIQLYFSEYHFSICWSLTRATLRRDVGLKHFQNRAFCGRFLVCTGQYLLKGVLFMAAHNYKLSWLRFAATFCLRCFRNYSTTSQVFHLAFYSDQDQNYDTTSQQTFSFAQFLQINYTFCHFTSYTVYTVC